MSRFIYLFSRRPHVTRNTKCNRMVVDEVPQSWRENKNKKKEQKSLFAVILERNNGENAALV